MSILILKMTWNLFEKVGSRHWHTSVSRSMNRHTSSVSVGQSNNSVGMYIFFLFINIYSIIGFKFLVLFKVHCSILGLHP